MVSQCKLARVAIGLPLHWNMREVDLVAFLLGTAAELMNFQVDAREMAGLGRANSIPCN